MRYAISIQDSFTPHRTKDAMRIHVRNKWASNQLIPKLKRWYKSHWSRKRWGEINWRRTEVLRRKPLTPKLDTGYNEMMAAQSRSNRCGIYNYETPTLQDKTGKQSSANVEMYSNWWTNWTQAFLKLSLLYCRIAALWQVKLLKVWQVWLPQPRIHLNQFQL